MPQRSPQRSIRLAGECGYCHKRAQPHDPRPHPQHRQRPGSVYRGVFAVQNRRGRHFARRVPSTGDCLLQRLDRTAGRKPRNCYEQPAAAYTRAEREDREGPGPNALGRQLQDRPGRLVCAGRSGPQIRCSQTQDDGNGARGILQQHRLRNRHQRQTQIADRLVQPERTDHESNGCRRPQIPTPACASGRGEPHNNDCQGVASSSRAVFHPCQLLAIAQRRVQRHVQRRARPCAASARRADHGRTRGGGRRCRQGRKGRSQSQGQRARQTRQRKGQGIRWKRERGQQRATFFYGYYHESRCYLQRRDARFVQSLRRSSPRTQKARGRARTRPQIQRQERCRQKRWESRCQSPTSCGVRAAIRYQASLRNRGSQSYREARSVHRSLSQTGGFTGSYSGAVHQSCVFRCGVPYSAHR
mmetsp:Transcript_30747/g.59963  ORF Transcript_30747/g.59963 Transcript_30747/m.59963 type:complete len:415 (+) Transcript_30747:2339-3583(+)